MALVLGVFTAFAGGAVAQDAKADNKAPAPMSAASAPSGAASGSAAEGKAPGRRPMADWWGEDVTPGWALMSWKERNEHRKRMRSMKDFEDCERYMEEHHRHMVERANERGKPALAEPKRDACAALK